jgi:hypothetical protein
LQIRLQRIVRGRVDRHAGHVVVHVVGDAQCLRAVELSAGRRLHVVRNHHFRQRRALLRRDCNHVNGFEVGSILRRHGGIRIGCKQCAGNKTQFEQRKAEGQAGEGHRMRFARYEIQR